MKEYLRITEVDSPKVGRYYMVKCAVYVRYHNTGIKLIPLIGELHSDNQFGFPNRHIHIDGRFAAAGEVDKNGLTNYVVDEPVVGSYGFHGKFMGYELRKMKCLRTTTGIDVPPIRNSIRAELYHEWYDTFVGKSCKGRKCPHLGEKMLERDGILVCPLHDLRGDIETETIVHREHWLNEKINGQ